MKYLLKLTTVLLLIAGLNACSDFLDPSTPQNRPTESISTVDDLNSLITGAYDRLSESNLYGRDYIVNAAARSDNAFSTGATNRFVGETTFQLTLLSGAASIIWANAYDVIANANLVINTDVGTTGPQVDYVKGQAYALRALAHMMILEYYGQQWVDGSDLGIPYVTTFAENENFFPSRPSVQETLNRIGNDFQQAVDLMDPSLDGDAYTMTYYGARALQARYALYAEDYGLAATAASDVIDNGGYSLTTAENLVTAWTAGLPSPIFAMDYTTSDNPGINGISYIYRGSEAGSGYGDVEATPSLYNTYEDGDVRQDLMQVFPDQDPITYRMSFKFPDVTGNNDHPIIRYAEVVLIYAEAQLQQDNAGGALTTLNMVPANRNASEYATATIDNILQERRKELAMEGRRYFALLRHERDISRTSLTGANAIRNITVPYGDHRLAFPISEDELDANSNIQQNEGYSGSQ